MPRAILLACLAFAAPAAAQDTARVAVAFTMGVRGQATGWDYAADEPAWGGLTRAATVLDSLRRAHPDHLVVADGGDLLTGSTFAAWLARNPRTPHPLVEALNLAGYDVATPGPRDAALGAERMGAAYAEARFPVVSASLVRAGGDGPALRPWAVIRRGPLRIAVTGIVTGTVSATGSLRARSLDAALPTLQAMRGEADAVVVFAHLAPGDRARLAELRALADLVVTADMRGPNGVWVAELDAVRAQGRWTVRAGAPRLLVLGLTPEQPRLLAGLADVHAEARAGLAKPLGRAGDTFSARMARAEPVPLVELLHRVQRRHAGATLSLVPIASVDVGLPLGDLRRRDLVALDPRQSPVRAVRVTGEQLKDVLETSARYYRLDAQRRPAVAPDAGDGQFVTVGGAAYHVDLSRPAGSRIRELTVRGRYVIPTDTFSLALTVAAANAIVPLRAAPVLFEGEVPLRELVAAEIEGAEVLDPARYATAEWRIVPEAFAEDVRRLWRTTPESAARGAPRPDSIALRVLSTNDFHGALETALQPDSTRLGGIAVLDAHMDSAAARCACPTLRLDAGDMLQGTLLSMADRGRTVLEAYRRLGLAAAAVGNHELDWGQDTLRARIAESSFPWLSANIVDSATGRRVPWVRSHVVVRAGELRVGIVGYVTRDTKRAVRAGNTGGLAITHGAAAIRDVLDSVRAQRPDVVILLAHEGGACQGTSCRGEIFELAEELGAGAVDVIVSGHSHTVIADEAGAIPIVQAGSNARGIGVVDLVRRPEGGYRAHVRVVRADAAEVTPDRELAALVEQAAKRNAKLAGREVARLRVAMRRDRGEHALGNFIADAYRNVTRADVAILNRGGVRADLDAGIVTYGELFAVSPFGDRLLTFELTGAELRGLLERAVEEAPPGGYFYSGVTLRYDRRRPRGERIVEARLADGRKLEGKRRYRLAASDYVAANRETALRLFERRHADAGVTDLEALERWFRRLPQPVDPPGTGRVRIEP